MNKGKGVVLFILMIVSLLAGCGKKVETEIGVNKRIELVVPAGLIGDELKHTSAELISTDVNNKTFSMSYYDRDKILNGIIIDTKNNIEVVIQDKTHYPDIKQITHNEDYTEFIIEIDGIEVSTYESMLAMSFYTVGNKYQIYNGVDIEDALTTVKYINANTDELIVQGDSSTMVY